MYVHAGIHCSDCHLASFHSVRCTTLQSVRTAKGGGVLMSNFKKSSQEGKFEAIYKIEGAATTKSSHLFGVHVATLTACIGGALLGRDSQEHNSSKRDSATARQLPLPAWRVWVYKREDLRKSEALFAYFGNLEGATGVQSASHLLVGRPRYILPHRGNARVCRARSGTGMGTRPVQRE